MLERGNTSKIVIVIVPDNLKDFRNFTYLVWKHLNLPDPTPVQYDICHYLQHGARRICIQAFRGVGKSWITSAFVCWSLLQNPQEKILVVSASKSRSDDFSNFTKRIINEMDILAHLKAKPEQRDSNIAFDVGPARASHAPSVKSIGITGQLTGSRSSIIVADDVETPSNSQTQMMRDKLSETIKELDAVLSPNGRVIFLGTPQSEMSLYSVLPERGYEIRCWTSRYPEDEKIEGYKGTLAPFITDRLKNGASSGEPTDPDRFNHTDLLEREASYGRSGFALQFQLDTSISDANRYPLKLSDFIVMDIDKELVPCKAVWGSDPKKICDDLPNVGLTGDHWYRPIFMSEEFSSFTGSVLSIDPSGRGSDETGYAVVKMLNGQLFLTDFGGFLGGYETSTLTKLAKIARDQEVNYVLVESNFGDGMFQALLKPILAKYYSVTIEEIKSNIQKEKRIIDTLEPVLNQHRLIIDPKLIRKDFDSTPDVRYQLFYQLTRITKDRGALVHDDRLDALSMAVAYWVEQMARDVDLALQEHKDEKMEAELERFMENAIGYKGKGNTWLDLK